MKLRLLLWLLLVLPGVSRAQTTDDNGIFVGEPKVYDDRSLQILLNTARANLARLQPLDITGLTSRIGNIQGADVTQNQFSLQAGSLPTVQNALTTAGGTPSTVQTATGGLTGGTSNTVAGGTSTTGTNTTTTNNTTTVNTTGTSSGNTLVTTTPSSTFQNVATQSSVTPLMPSLPGASTVSLPSATGISALDALNEQMQLTYEIANLQLLLEGSLSDRFIRGTRQLKQRTTIGFPMSILPPQGDEYKDAVAEVEVTVVNAPAVGYPAQRPSVTALLPREKTYNVANIRESSFSVSAGAVVAGLLNVGGGFFHGHRTFYLIKDQDTVALQRAPHPFIDHAPGASLTIHGARGEETLWYWIIAHFPNDVSVPYGPVVAQNTVGTSHLSNQDYVHLQWAPLEDAMSYDVLRSASEKFPQSCNNCRISPVMLNATAFDDQGGPAGPSAVSPLPSATFAWQFKPVLGQKTISAGLRQTFVQLALPIEKRNCGVVAQVRIVRRWLRYNAKTGVTGEVIQESVPFTADIPSFDLTPQADDVQFQDLGNGSIEVSVKGDFMEGTRVRVGNLFLDNLVTPEGIQFIAPAQPIATMGAFLVNRDGKEREILLPDGLSNRRIPSCGTGTVVATPVSGPADGFIFTSAPQGAAFVVDNNPGLSCVGACRLVLPPGPHTVTATLGGYAPYSQDFVSPNDIAVDADLNKIQQVKIASVAVTPFNDTTSEVLIAMHHVPDDIQNAAIGEGTHIVPAPNPLVVLVGNKLFGLNDSPLEVTKPGNQIALRFLAPTTLLSTYHSVTVERIFWGKAFSDSRDIKERLDTFPNDSEFAISKLNLLSNGEVTVFAVTGTHLNNVTVISPESQAFETLPPRDTNATIGLLRIDKEKMKNLKQIVLRKGNGAVVILPLPDDSKAKPKPAVKDDHVSVTPGTQSIEILGTALDQTATIKCQGKLLTFRFLKDKGSLVVDLSTITVTEGVRFLDITFADGTASRFQVEVAAKTIS